MHRNQFGELVRGYWDLRGEAKAFLSDARQHVNRKWTFYILGTFLGSVFAQICRQIVFIRVKKLSNTNLVASGQI